MKRYRPNHKRTEEEKRNLKVDLKRVPEWEAEIESIRSRFRRFSLSEMSAAASLILEMELTTCSESGRQRTREEFDRWKSKLSADTLIHLSKKAPWYIRDENWVTNRTNETRSKLEETERKLAEYRSRGVSDSFWAQLFSSKVDSETVRNAEKRKTYYLAILRASRVAEPAARSLREVLSESRECSERLLKIKEVLQLAAEKRRAVERFEAKERVLAKAAAVDNKTRSRASSLKILVKKTKDCPYCGEDLGLGPHLDHIYPVSKGGLSIVENLVWCCSACNVAKTDKGLIQFLKERDLSIDRTLSRLHALGKHV
jgi:5-methylcytosine-specific restriction endonuclease McrA